MALILLIVKGRWSWNDTEKLKKIVAWWSSCSLSWSDPGSPLPEHWMTVVMLVHMEKVAWWNSLLFTSGNKTGYQQRQGTAWWISWFYGRGSEVPWSISLYWQNSERTKWCKAMLVLALTGLLQLPVMVLVSTADTPIASDPLMLSLLMAQLIKYSLSIGLNIFFA